MQRIIIAGFGFMGGIHAQAYARIPGAEVVAVVDIDPARAQAQATKIGLTCPIIADLGQALAEVPSDVVDVCVPTYLHTPIALTALAAGRHVFCEKPLCMSAAEAAKIKAAVKKARRRFMVGQCIRFWPEYQAFSEFHRAKRAGKLLSLTLQRRAGRPSYSAGDWLNKAERSLGAAADLHIHDTDYLLHLLGRPKAVRSVGTRDKSGWSHIFTTYEYPGICVQAEGGWNYPAQWGFRMSFQALYERAAVEFDSSATPTLRVTYEGKAPEPLPFHTPGAGNSTAGTGNVSSLGGYYNELAYFIDCLERGIAPAIATLDHGTASLKTVLAEIRSAETGRPVALKG